MKIKNLLSPVLRSLGVVRLAILALNLAQINGYIVKLEALKSQENNQYIINTGDAHFGCCKRFEHPKGLTFAQIANLNKKHAQELISFTQKYDPKECLFIVEDIYDYQGTDSVSQKYFAETRSKNETSNFTNCMSYITDLCKERNINVCNAEFRQSLLLFSNQDIYNSGQFLTDFHKIVNEIKNYRDGEKIDKYNISVVQELLDSNKEILDILEANKDKKIKEIKSQCDDIDNFATKFNKLVHEYYTLLDARIIHTILQNPDKKYIFICAGNYHLENTNSVLKQINYKEIVNLEDKELIFPINIKDALSKIDITRNNTEIELPYVFIILICIAILNISFPRRFRILHFHSLKS